MARSTNRHLGSRNKLRDGARRRRQKRNRREPSRRDRRRKRRHNRPENSPAPLFDSDGEDEENCGEPTNEETELDELIEKYPKSIGRYAEYQWNRNREFQQYDDPDTVIRLLGSANAKNPSAHPLWRTVKTSMRRIARWKRGHTTWKQARRRRRVPFVPTSAELGVILYLKPEINGYPDQLSDAMRAVNLDWLAGGPWTRFWNGALFDDPEWRAKHMVADRRRAKQCEVPDADIAKVEDLLKAVLPKRPAGVVKYKHRSERCWPPRPGFGGITVADRPEDN
jgi:hypothetical protein